MRDDMMGGLQGGKKRREKEKGRGGERERGGEKSPRSLLKLYNIPVMKVIVILGGMIIMMCVKCGIDMLSIKESMIEYSKCPNCGSNGGILYAGAGKKSISSKIIKLTNSEQINI